MGEQRVMCGRVIGDDGWRQVMWWGKRAMGEGGMSHQLLSNFDERRCAMMSVEN